MNATDFPRRRWWHSPEANVLVAIGLVVAIGLGWLGWQVSIVQHRRAMRAQIMASGQTEFTGKGTLRTGPVFFGGSGSIKRLTPPPATVQIRTAELGREHSRLRQLLGDQEISSLYFWRPLTAADRTAIDAFPEADVRGVPDPLP
jgi:hypothetical protein